MRLLTEENRIRTTLARWDIFCRIVDNFGDIGVCWRLARQLTHEHGYSVRLWVDDLPTAAGLIPTLNTALSSQTINSVEIRPWADAESTNTLQHADVVIEAFACELPPSYVAQMAMSKPLWINLEYLSAEGWVKDFHGQPSPHPTVPLTKYFYFPGFSENTGGLLRERDLLAQRDAFLHSPEAQAEFKKNLAIAESDAFTVSLFCYPSAPIGTLLECMAKGSRETLCLIPATKTVLSAVSAWLGITEPAVGDSVRRGNLQLQVLPFLSQHDYDRLLWSADLNFVRGEDSWVRAIWAGQPFIWQPYQQAENAHQAKLEAFLDDYAGQDESGKILREFFRNWSDSTLTAHSWHALLDALPQLRAQAELQSQRLAMQPDLAAKLVIYVEKLSGIRV